MASNQCSGGEAVDKVVRSIAGIVRSDRFVWLGRLRRLCCFGTFPLLAQWSTSHLLLAPAIATVGTGASSETTHQVRVELYKSVAAPRISSPTAERRAIARVAGAAALGGSPSENVLRPLPGVSH